MTSISNYMGSDHRRCDELFAIAEGQASKGDWTATKERFDTFHKATEHHFHMEEDVLFPTFEQASGMSMGPTQVMRMEHGQMRELFASMQEALERQDSDAFLGDAETLLILMQQHNMKEEQMLYPMTEQTFGAQGEDVLAKMQALE